MAIPGTFARERRGAGANDVIASATASAVEAAQAARRTAGNKMAEVSDGLSHRLNDAATRYDQTDGAMGGRLDNGMPR